MAQKVQIPFCCHYKPPECQEGHGEPTWEAEGTVIPELNEKQELIDKIIVMGGAGFCPTCANPGTADTSNLDGDLKTATVVIL